MTLSACPLLSIPLPDMSVRPPPFKGADKRTDGHPGPTEQDGGHASGEAR